MAVEAGEQLFLNLRAKARGGPLAGEPSLWKADGRSAPRPTEVPGGLRSAVFAIHGFNVDQEAGIASLSRLAAALDLPNDHTVIGVLWPGDSWLPTVNYPLEGRDADLAGALLARWIEARLDRSVQVAFVTHSLGARLALSAARGLGKRARVLAMAAPAVDDDCLPEAGLADSARVSILASKRDLVLRLAYRLGDMFEGDRRNALGFHGPRPSLAGVDHGQIPSRLGYGHDDYFPPAKGHNPKCAASIAFLREALIGAPHGWPI